MKKFIRFLVCIVVAFYCCVVVIKSQTYPNVEKHVKITTNFDGGSAATGNVTNIEVSSNTVTDITPVSKVYNLGQSELKEIVIEGMYKYPPAKGTLPCIDPICEYTKDNTYTSTPLENEYVSIPHDMPNCDVCKGFAANISYTYYRVNNTLKMSGEITSPIAFDSQFSFDGDNTQSNLNEYIHVDFTKAGTTTPVFASTDLSAGSTSFTLSDLQNSSKITYSSGYSYDSLIGQQLYLITSYRSSTISYSSTENKPVPIMFVDRVSLANSSLTANSPTCYGKSDGGFTLSGIQMASGLTAPSGTTFRAVLRKKVCSDENDPACWRSITKTDGGDAPNDTSTYEFTSGETIQSYKAGAYRLVIYGQNMAADIVQTTIDEAPEVTTSVYFNSPGTQYNVSSGGDITLDCYNSSGSVEVVPSTQNYNGNYIVKLDIGVTQIDPTEGNPVSGTAHFTGITAPKTCTVLVQQASGHKCSLQTNPSIIVKLGTSPSLNTPTIDNQPACSAHPNGQISISINKAGHNSSTDIFTYSIFKDGTRLSDTTSTNQSHTYYSLSPGTYTFQVTDIMPCASGITSAETLAYDVANNPHIFSGIIKQPTCDRSVYDGSIQVGSYGGHGDTTKSNRIYSCTNQTGQSNQGKTCTFSNLPATTYTLLVKDGYGCPSTSISKQLSYSNSYSFTSIIAAKKVTINGTDYQTTCNPSNDANNNSKDGQITVNATVTKTNSTNSITGYKLTTESSYRFPVSSLLENIPESANPYYIKIKDYDGCEYTSTTGVTITSPPVIGFNNSLTQHNISCYGGDDGRMMVGYTNVTYPVSVHLTNDTTKTLTTLLPTATFWKHIAGKFNYAVTDANGCVTSTSITLTQPTAALNATLKVIDYNGRHVSCNGKTDGRIQAIISGGTANYNAYLYNSSNVLIDSAKAITAASHTATFIKKGLGKYRVFVKDANGCTFSDTISLYNEPDSLKITQVNLLLQPGSIYHLTCNGKNDGQIRVKATGGTFGYSVHLKKPDASVITKGIWKSQNQSDSVTFSSLTVGGYHVLVNDTNGCVSPANGSFDTKQHILTQPDPITVSLPPAPVQNNGYYITCHGHTINLAPNSVKGGNGSYNYNNYYYTWSNGQSDSTARGITPKYGSDTMKISVTVHDSKNCPTATATVIINEPDTIQITRKERFQPLCSYSNDGNCSIYAKGGVQPYTFFLDSDSVKVAGDSAYFDSLLHKDSPGFYVINIHDYFNCGITDSLALYNRPVLTLNSPVVAIPHCHGGNDGTITLSGQKGQTATGNYTFSITDDGATRTIIGSTVTFDTIRGGHYPAAIMDDFGCFANINVPVDDARQIDIEVKLKANRCYNDSSAGITLIASNAYPPYKFMWKYEKNKSDSFELSSDATLTLKKLNWNVYNDTSLVNYYFQVRDANFVSDQSACTIICKPVTLPIVQEMKIQLTNTPISCLGNADASITVNQVLNYQGNFSYKWHSKVYNNVDTVTSKRISGLTFGPYSVRVTDSHQCVASADTVIKNPAPLTVSVVSVFPETAPARNDGKVMLSVGGTGNTIWYRINSGLWNTALLDNKSLIIAPLAPGLYSVNIANPFKTTCTASTAFRIKHQPPVLTLVGKRPATSGNADGMLSVAATATGGAGGYRYIWLNNGDTIKQYHTSIDTTLRKGVYSVLAIDADSLLSTTITDTITESDKLQLGLLSVQEPTCNHSPNGSARVSAGGGNKPYTYWWTNVLGNTISADSTTNSLSSGKYKAHVKDARGIDTSIMVTVFAIDTMYSVLSDTLRPLCYGERTGSITIDSVLGGSGKYTYQWSTGATTKNIGGLGLGTYTVTVYDAAAGSQVCYLKKSVTLASQPDSLKLHVKSITLPTCYGGGNGKIILYATGGTHRNPIQWAGLNVTGDTLFNVKGNSSYQAKVVDYNGCTTAKTVMVKDTAPLYYITKVTQPHCYGSNSGTISVTMMSGRPGYLAKWTPDLHTSSLQVMVSASPNPYKVTISDQNGCTVTDSFTVKQPLPLQVDSFAYIMPACSYSSNGSITAYVSGGTKPYLYKWQDYSNTRQTKNLSGRKDSVVVRDSNYCQTTGYAELKTPAALKITNIALQQPSCSGYNDGSMSITASGGTGQYSYLLNSQASVQQPGNLYANTYNITVKDANGCSAGQSVWLGQPSPLTALVNIISMAKCSGQCTGEVKLTASGSFAPYLFGWNDGKTDSDRTSICVGNYQVKVSDQHKCYVNKYVFITEPDPLLMNSYQTTSPICYGSCDGKLSVMFIGGTKPYSYSWNTGQTNTNALSRLCAGDYTVAVKDSNNCSISKTLHVAETPKVSITTFPNTFQICEGQMNNINPGQWAIYSWYFNGQKVSNASVYNANQTGNYAIGVISNKGCTDSANFTVTVSNSLLHADFIMPSQAITDDTVEIVNVTWPVADSLTWHFVSDSIRVIEDSLNRKQLMFKYAGEYNITLIAKKALCVSEELQTIVVYNTANEKNRGQVPDMPQGEIEELYLYPNPSTGSFTVKLKLSSIGVVHLRVSRLSDGTLIGYKDGDGSDAYEIAFNLPGLSPGVYVVGVQTTSHQKNIKFVILR